MADFYLFKVKVFDQYFSILEMGLTLKNGVEWRIARQNRFSRFGCTLIKERKKFFKKRTNTYMLGMCTSVQENFSETKFCSII